MPTMYEAFVAGAKDFGLDMKRTLDGTSKGPSFDNRKALLEGESRRGNDQSPTEAINKTHRPPQGPAGNGGEE